MFKHRDGLDDQQWAGEKQLSHYAESFTLNRLKIEWCNLKCFSALLSRTLCFSTFVYP